MGCSEEIINRLKQENELLLTQIKQSLSHSCSEQAYIVQGIVGHKVRNKRRLFRVRWEVYSIRDDTWEPEEGLKRLNVYKSYVRKHFK